MSKVNALIGGILGLVVVGIIVIWSGVYNVAATVPHFGVTKWFFATVRDQSVAVRADTIRAPADLHAAVDREQAVRSFHDMCVGCHSAPGLDASVVRRGLNPKPPKLSEERVQGRRDPELFWIISHGIKMTGMPAFGPTHKDEDIWELVAFIRELPKMEEEDYKALMAATGIKEERTGHAHHDGPPQAQDGDAPAQSTGTTGGQQPPEHRGR